MTQDSNKVKKNLFLIIVLLIGLGGGIMLGMVIQQMIFIAGAVEIAEGLEGTEFNIEIDLNETILVDTMMNRMEDMFEEPEKEEETKYSSGPTYNSTRLG